jgi:hypothetical protein
VKTAGCVLGEQSTREVQDQMSSISAAVSEDGPGSEGRSGWGNERTPFPFGFRGFVLIFAGFWSGGTFSSGLAIG